MSANITKVVKISCRLGYITRQQVRSSVDDMWVDTLTQHQKSSQRSIFNLSLPQREHLTTRAQWSSRPPQGQKIVGSNPDRV
jgi:hypothetical protein